MKDERAARKRKKQRKRERPRVCNVDGLNHRVVWLTGVAWVLDCSNELPGPGAKYFLRTKDTVITCLWCVARCP